jgi:hypothetical protein
LASVDERSGVLKTGAEITGSSSACIGRPSMLPTVKRGDLVEFDTQQAESYGPPLGTGSAPALTLPDIERRTPPGRTIITGVALPQVSSITLSTPSDVRTLRPSGPLHTIIAVYDGYFLRGQVTATIRLRNGLTRTEDITSGPARMLVSNPQPQSMAVQLSSAERQLAEIRHPRLSVRGHHHAVDPRLVGAIQADIDKIRRRIAYEQLRPGLLPAE